MCRGTKVVGGRCTCTMSRAGHYHFPHLVVRTVVDFFIARLDCVSLYYCVQVSLACINVCAGSFVRYAPSRLLLETFPLFATGSDGHVWPDIPFFVFWFLDVCLRKGRTLDLFQLLVALLFFPLLFPSFVHSFGGTRQNRPMYMIISNLWSLLVVVAQVLGGFSVMSSVPR